jgi:hypothetical protein
MTENNHNDIVFDGPPSHESGRFVEVENAKGASIAVGEWVHRDDGYWVLRLTVEAFPSQLANAQYSAWDEGVEAGLHYATHDHTPGGQSIDPPSNPYTESPGRQS